MLHLLLRHHFQLYLQILSHQLLPEQTQCMKKCCRHFKAEYSHEKKTKAKSIAKITSIFAKMITYLLFHLWDQKDQRCPSLLAFPEDLEDPHHLKHRWDQGYPSVTSITVNTS